MLRLAKICIYCGRELGSGEKCTCTGSAARTAPGAGGAAGAAGAGWQQAPGAGGGSAGAKRESRGAREQARRQEQRTKEQAREQARRERGRAKAQARFTRGAPGAGGIRDFILKVMTSRGFLKSEPFPAKAALSLFQTILRPVAGAEAFVRNCDSAVSILYIAFFSASFSLALMRVSSFTLRQFGEGLLFGAAAYLALCALTFLAFRFLLRAGYSYRQHLAAYSAPSIYLSLFLLLSSAGRTGMIPFAMTAVTGLIAAVLLHFISLKALSGQSTERLLTGMILVYFIFFMIFGMAAGLAVTVPAMSGTAL